MTAARERRGPYAKGVRRREEILDRALAVYDEVGFRNVSLSAVGESIGVTHAALRHYFASTDDLLLAVLQRADDRALDGFDIATLAGHAEHDPAGGEVDGRGAAAAPDDQRALSVHPVHPVHPVPSVVAEFSRRLARESAEVPGLTALYATMAARAGEAGDSDEHGARAFFTARYQRVRNFAQLVLEAGREQGRVRDDVPLDTAAALLIAAADGLTTQWLIDPTTDLERGLRLLDQLLLPVTKTTTQL